MIEVSQRAREAGIDAAALHVLSVSRKGTASTNEYQRAADDARMLEAYRDIIGKAWEFLAAPSDSTAGLVEPFAILGRMLDGPFAPVLFKDSDPITFGDLRRAAAALRQHGETK